MSKLSVTHFLIGSMTAIVLSSSGLFIDSYAQNIIGYSESTIIVKDEQTYCTSNTLELTDASIKDTKGNKVTDIKVGSQVVVEASVTSNCEISNYPILILLEVRDSEGMTRYLALQNTTMSQGEQTTSGFSWMANEAGDYELGVLTHACLNCSGDFGIIKRLDFSVTRQSVGENEYIDLTISGLKSTYQIGEQIIFSVEAEGVLDNACNIGSPSIYMRDDSNGKTIYWPHPFGFNTAMGCAGPESIDKVWMFGDNAENEIVLDKAGSYTVVASLEDITIEKKFVVTS